MRRIGERVGAGLALLALLFVLAAPEPVRAQGFIRDAEIERTLTRMSAPILKAAGMPVGSVSIHIVNSRQLNAFVAAGRNMFLNSGLLLALETPDELIGVIAHEVGHLAGGHQERRAIQVRRAQGPALLGLLAGLAVAVAGGGEAAAAITAGSQQAITRSFLAFNRGEEAAADQAALRYLEIAGISPNGLLKVMQRFRGQEVFTVGNTDPYALTHPLSTERLQLIEERAAATRAAPLGPESEMVYWHRRMRAKLDGFLSNPRSVLRRLDREAADDEVALYARAIALHRLPAPREALAAMDALLAMRRSDPYYLELKGQILYESARAEEAVPLYRAAVGAAPDEPLLKAGLGRALLALERPDTDAEALAVLKQARAADRGDTVALRDLAVAYSRAGDLGMATLATAERFALLGRNRDAVLHAKRASAALPEGSPGWLRAQDILVLDKSAD